MPSEKSRFIQRCVADVTAQGKELKVAFAICTAQSQKSGYSKPGSSKMTGKGAAREKAFKNADDMQAKSAEYERAVQAGRQEEISMRALIRDLEEAKKASAKHAQDSEDRAKALFRKIADDPGISDVRGKDGDSARDKFLRTLVLLPEKGQADYKHDVLDRLEKDVRAHHKSNEALVGKASAADRRRGKEMVGGEPKKTLNRAKSSVETSSETDDMAARQELRAADAQHRKLGAGGGHVGSQKIFTGSGAALDKLKAGGPERKSVDVGGEGTMPGPDGQDVEGKWVTVKGKRLFFPDNPGDEIPDGPWGGGPGRPGWDGKGGGWHSGKGVMPQKGQLSLFGKHESMESLFQSIEESSGNMWGGRMGPADK